ncbi:tyrosine-protein phosphatase [Marinibacterium sp. SX1]|uniref:tyrosine-protein phosphatase n=1 Tax=Marinibacterium sp. SX1 TaxID=3388424 RepID=UPI003D168257
MSLTRHIPVPGVLNLRDLGGYPTGRGDTAWRRVLRAASLHDLDPAGIAELEALGLSHVIDLRYADEIAKRPNPFAGRTGATRYSQVSLLAGLSPEAPEISAAPDPLLALYLKAAETNAAGFVEVARLIAGTPQGAVLFHCSAGKDRTGMIAAMMLELAGVSRACILDDYACTADHIAPFVEATRLLITRQGGDFDSYAPFLRSDPPTMAGFLDHLADRHGGAAGYLLAHGLSPADLGVLQRRLGAADG